jgi:hypothetical protein
LALFPLRNGWPQLTVAVTCSKQNAKITLDICATELSVLEPFVHDVTGSGEPLMVLARLAADSY